MKTDIRPRRLETVKNPATVGDLFPVALTHGVRRTSRILGAATMLLGLLVLAGRALEVDLTKTMLAPLTTMKANSALGFTVAGAALLASGGRRLRFLVLPAATVTVLIGLLTLAQYVFHRDLGIDQLLLADRVASAYPGRMAPSTAACFVVLGCSLMAGHWGLWRLSALLSGLPMLVGFLAILGYFYGVSSLYRISTYTSMAAHTALGFIAASIGVRMLGPSRGLVFASSSAGGMLVRRMIGQAAAGLSVLGWLSLTGERAGLYGTEMALAIVTSGGVVITTGLTQRTARLLHRVDVERQEAVDALRWLNVDLEDRIGERTAELAASEERFRKLAEAASEALVVHEGGSILEVNGVVEEVFGYRAEELIGQQGVDQLVAPEYRAVARARIAAASEDRFELECLRKDGSCFAASCVGRAIDYGGRTVRVTAVRDVTHHKRVEETLRTALEREQEAARLLETARDRAIEASRLKSDFLATMSHEIRTPMNAVIGMTGLLIDTSLTPQQREYARAVRGAGEALLEIVNDILDFSKIEAGMLRIEPTAFELRLVVEEVADLLASRAHEKGLELATFVEHDVPAVVWGDPGRVRQVLTNLAGNAVKFTASGEVVVTVTLCHGGPGPTLRFEVADTGIGISAEGQRHLFQSFHQVDSSAARRHGGTGLGLAISKQLVELMGGEIGITSEPRVGSTFWFTLPVQVSAQADGAPPARPELPTMRALVADDNAALRRLLERHLRGWGLATAAAPGAAGALEALREAAARGRPFDVAFVDAAMAGIGGAAGAAEPALAHTRIVLLTSRLHRRHDRAGAGVGHLTKPLRESDLRECLDRAAGRGVPEAAVPASGKPAGVGCGGRVLVAEDNPVNQLVAIRMLERIGCRADVVGNGAEAVEALARIDYVAVLMDCQMPEMDGFEATRRIRQAQRPPKRTPVIAMTADAMQGDRERCFEAGMDDYLSKPVRPEDLETVLRRWVPFAGDARPADSSEAAAGR